MLVVFRTLSSYLECVFRYNFIYLVLKRSLYNVTFSVTGDHLICPRDQYSASNKQQQTIGIYDFS